MLKSINFVSPSVNCTIWCEEVLRLFCLTDALADDFLRKKAAILKEQNPRTLLIPREWFYERCHGERELVLELIIKPNSLTGKDEAVYHFIRKVYSYDLIQRDFSEEFTIP